MTRNPHKSIPRGSPNSPRIDQLQPFPGSWVTNHEGLAQIQIRFDEPVIIPPDAVRLWTLLDGAILNAGSVYDSATNTLTLSLPSPIHADRLTVVIDFTVTDTSGNPLDGEIDSPSFPALPSGDGRPGGQAVIRYNVLQADANHDGLVNASDQDIVIAALGRCQTDFSFDSRADLNADGCINVLDTAIFNTATLQALPGTYTTFPEISALVPAPLEGLQQPLASLLVQFTEPIDPSHFGARSLFVLDSAGNIALPATASLSPDGLSASYDFSPSLVQCETYSVNVSNALANSAGALLARPASQIVYSGTVPPPPILDPYAPRTNNTMIMFTGTAPGAATVEVVGPLGAFEVPIVGVSFSASVQLKPNFVNRVFFEAKSPSCSIPSAPTLGIVTHDAEAPSVFIDYPTNGAILTKTTTDITGRVSDMLSGFVGLTVMVNGVSAVVHEGVGTNGTFFAPSIPLTKDGATNIEAIALDALANMNITSITVYHMEVPPSMPRIERLSGNNQFAQIHSTLPNPIAVRVLRSDGTSFASKVVTFHVVRSDGRLLTPPGGNCLGNNTMTLQCIADLNGDAGAIWQLGSDAGSGNNRVEVTSTSLPDTVVFCASTLPGPEAQINIGGGNNQRAETGSVAPERLRVRVSDGCNGVSGIPVTFRVLTGGGAADGTSETDIYTTTGGYAEVEFRLGVMPGNNLVEADFPNNPSEPAVFQIVGLQRDPTKPTSFVGLVLDNSNQPLGGADILLVVAGITVGQTTSATDGSFSISNIAFSGHADVFVYADSIDTVAGQPLPPGGRYPSMHYETTVVPNVENSLSMPILLPKLTLASDLTYEGSQANDLILTCAGLEGFRMILRAGTTITLPDGLRVGPNDPGNLTLSLNQVHHDEIPMPMPDGAAPLLAWTLQPGGAHFDKPVEIEYPNMSGLPSGALANFLSFNHDTGRFEIIATGTVTEDGALIKTDRGVGITNSGWGGACPPYSVTGPVEKCPTPPTIKVTDCDAETEPIDRDPDNNQFNQNKRFENHVRWSSGAASLKTGNLTVRHKCVTYRRMGTERGIELVYNSTSAHASPTITVPLEADAGVYDVQLSVAGQPITEPPPPPPKPRSTRRGRGVRSGRIPRIQQEEGSGINVPGTHVQNTTGPSRYVTNFDATTLVTGIYPYTVQLTDDEENGATLSDYVIVRNEITSPVGPGWTIAEVHQIKGFEDSSAYLFALGNGSNLVVRNPENEPPAEDCDFPLPWTHSTGVDRTPADFSQLTVNQNGTISRRLPNGSEQIFANGKLVTKRDRNGNETTYVYVGELLVRITDPTGGDTVFHYDSDGLLDRITDPAGRDTLLEHDENGNLTKITDPDQAEHRFVYDNEHKLLFEFDALDIPTQYVYDPITGQLTEIVFADGSSRKLGPAQLRHDGPSCQSTATYSDATGADYQIEMDALGRVLSITDPGGAIRRWERDTDGLATKFIDARGKITEMTYDDRGNLEDTINPLGHTTHREYHKTFNFLTLLRDPDGDETAFIYDGQSGDLEQSRDAENESAFFDYFSDGLPQEAIDRNGNVTRWTYTASRRLPSTRIMDPGGLNLTTRFTNYNDAGFAQDIEDPRGIHTAISYDEMNRITSRTVDPGGLNLTTSYTYWPDGKLKTVTAPHDGLATATTSYAYNNRRRLRQITKEITGALDAVTVINYDAEGHITSVLDPELKATTVGYNFTARRVTIMDDTGQTIRRSFDKNYNLSELKNQRDVITKYEYDALNRLTKTIVDAGNGRLNLTTERIYPTTADGDGSVEGNHPRTIIDPEDRRTVFDYDDLDRVLKETRQADDTSDAVTEFQYDDEGRLTSVEDPNDIVTSFQYDNANRLIHEILDPTGLNYDTEYVPDPNGNIGEIRLPNGNVIVNTHDNANRLRFTDDSIGRVVENRYYPSGRIHESFDGDGRRTAFTYDRLGRLLATTDGLGNADTYTYDKVGNRLSLLDRNGQLTTYEYDDLHRLEFEHRPLNLDTQYAYDEVGNRTLIHDANGGDTRFEYDYADRQTKLTFADNGIMLFEYDKVGNLKERKNPDDSVVLFGYDDLNRLRTRTYPGAQDTYTYDEGGRMLTANNSTVSLTFGYDKADRVTSINQGGAQSSFVYSVSSGTNYRRVTYPSGRTIQENHDKRDRLANIDEAGIFASFGYNLANLKATTAFANGVTSTRTYDANRRLKTVTHNNPGNFINVAYGYDDVGNLVYAKKYHDEEDGVLADYDPLNRLREFDRGIVDITGTPSITTPSTLPDLVQAQDWLDLDPLGNWKSIQTVVNGMTNTESRTVNGVNEYLTAGGVSLSHDDNGNTTDDGQYTYSYDALNRLRSMTRKSDSVVVLQNDYDARDYRVRATREGGQTTDYVFDSDWRMLEDRPVGGTLSTYVYGQGQDEVIQKRQGGTAHYFHASKLGTIDAATNASGQVVERYRYDAYGRRLVYNAAGQQLAISAIGNSFGFTGRLHDVTNLIDLRNRFYQTGLGRFLQRDPAGFVGDVNLYQYASSAPLGRYDLLGLQDEPEAPPPQPTESSEEGESVSGSGPGNSSGTDTTDVPLPPQNPLPGKATDQIVVVSDRVQSGTGIFEDFNVSQAAPAAVPSDTANSTSTTTRTIAISGGTGTRTTTTIHPDPIMQPRTSETLDESSVGKAFAQWTREAQIGLTLDAREGFLSGEFQGFARALLLDIPALGFMEYMGGESLSANILSLGVSGATRLTHGGSSARIVPAGTSSAAQALDRIAQVRQALDVGGARTIAIARTYINGVGEEVIGISGQALRGTMLGSSRIAPNTLRLGPGRLDAEVKILDDLHSRLPSSSIGTIDLFIERPSCLHCGEAILQFRSTHPNIRLNVVAP